MTKFFGGLLMAAGIVIATLSGLCSARFLMSTMGGSGNSSGMGLSGADGGALVLMLIAVVGGVPFLTGIWLFNRGRALVRAEQARGE